MFRLRCIECGEVYPEDEAIYTCRCGGLLEAFEDIGKLGVEKAKFASRPLGVWRYRELLPVRRETRIISLGEGGTPLYKAASLASKLGMRELYVKNEGANPTGSFKDRGMTVGVTRALSLGSRAVGCASTGNTSASLAAYAAKAGIKCVVLLPSGKIALGKLAQAILHGAVVIGIKGNFDVALKLIRRASEEFNIYLLNSINPWRLEGQKTEAYEIAEQLGYEAPDTVVVPMGNCGNISAIWKGFKEFYEAGILSGLPRMIGIQAEGASPVVEAYKKGEEKVKPLGNPETIATAIRIGAPVNAPKALRAIRESKGCAEAVSDEEIIKAQKLLARAEGIGVEPASAASIAGLKKLLAQGVVKEDERVVCVTTGHALKDPEMIFNHYEKPALIAPELEELGKVLKL
jgi:threonine synthase